MKKNILGLAIAGALLSVMGATSANANLLINGSFEDIPDASNQVAGGGNQTSDGWALYDSANVNGYDGDLVELWTNRNPGAYEGSVHAELNSGGTQTTTSPGGAAFRLSQSFTTTIGQTYDVSFAYRARLSNNEAFNLTVGNIDIDISDHVTTEWSTYSGSFTATSTLTSLNFTSINPLTDTAGNFIDDVSVTVATGGNGGATGAVPEPASIALLGLGLAGLGFSRKKMKKA